MFLVIEFVSTTLHGYVRLEIGHVRNIFQSHMTSIYLCRRCFQGQIMYYAHTKCDIAFLVGYTFQMRQTVFCIYLS